MSVEDKFLQEFLKTGLFDIGDNDERLKQLQASIKDLQKKLIADYSLLPKAALVALDPNISDTEPIMIEAESLIAGHWTSLRAKYTEMPRNIIRGVILNALHNIGTAEPVIGRIIFLTAQSFYPYSKLNNEKSLISGMLNLLGEISEENAVEEWSLIEEEPKLKLGTLKITDLKFGSIEIDKSLLKTGMKTAIENEPSTNYGSPNGGETSWGEHFATKSTEAITKSFNNALKEFTKLLNPSSIEVPINRFFTEFKKSLDANLKTSFSTLTAVERRSKLLWWKETLYSSSQKRSYREIEKNLLPILMSADLNNQIPKITPISVDFLLKDTLFLLNGSQDELVSFSGYLNEIAKEENKIILKSYFETPTESEGRISVTDFISLLVNDRININKFKERTGIDAKEKITFGNLSVVILHDLLIQRLITK